MSRRRFAFLTLVTTLVTGRVWAEPVPVKPVPITNCDLESTAIGRSACRLADVAFGTSGLGAGRRSGRRGRRTRRAASGDQRAARAARRRKNRSLCQAQQGAAHARTSAARGQLCARADLSDRVLVPGSPGCERRRVRRSRPILATGQEPWAEAEGARFRHHGTRSRATRTVPRDPHGCLTGRQSANAPSTTFWRSRAEIYAVMARAKSPRWADAECRSDASSTAALLRAPA